MRILQVIEFFTPGMGGSVQVVYQTARHLAYLGHQVTICTSDYGRGQSAFLDQPFQVHYFSSLPTRWNFYVTPGLLPWAWRHVGKYDIIHMHNVRTLQNTIIGAAARRKGVPYVNFCAWLSPLFGKSFGVKRGFDMLFGDRLIAGAEQMIAVSEVEAGQFEQAGIPGRKIALISNGFDLDEFANLPPCSSFRSKHSILDSEKMILFLGRIHPIKGLDHLIAAFSDLSRSLEGVWLVIAGPDDGDLSRLQALARKIPDGQRVLFPGPLYGDGKLAALVDADVLASSSSSNFWLGAF